MDIKVVDGTYYYWPKGDANSQVDGCWVPHTSVNGYIIELHNNTNPENASLRERVNSAKAERDEALQIYEAKEVRYNRKLDYYNAKYIEYCGSLAGGCQLAEPYYSELNQLYDELVRLEGELVFLYNDYIAAYDAWEQAYNEAAQE